MADADYISEKQNILSIQLGKYMSVAKDAYLGAIHALYSEEYPDRLAQFAYSLREVIDLLTRKNQNDVERKSPIAKEYRAHILASVIDPVGKQVYEFYSLYQQLVHQYDELSGYAHHRPTLEQIDAEKRLEIIEGILSRFTRPQIEILDDIDEIIYTNPSEEGAIKLKKYLFRWSSHSYLLEKLPCEWLEPLHNTGFFDNPPPMISKQKDSGKFYYWMPSGYLAKCVGSMPELVCEIILKYQFKDSDERNLTIYDDFLKCSLELSVTDMQKIAQKAIDEKWHDFAEPYLITKQYAELAERLYLAGKYDIAINMLSSLFTSIKTDSLKFYNNYIFEEILNKNISRLIEKNPLPVAKLLVFFIEHAIKHDNAKLDGNKSNQSDLSYLLLAAIEDHEQNHYNLHRILPLCMIKLRDCLMHLGYTNPQELKSNMNILSEKKYYIFRRLEIFLYDKFNSFFNDEISKTFVDFFDTDQVYHEYYNLIKNTFGKMPDEIQEKIMDKIEKTSLEKFNDVKINKGEKVANSRKKYWILRKLEPLHEYLEGKNKKLYEDLALELGKIKNPDFLSYMEVSMGKSAADPTTFEEKTPDEIFEIVKKYGPIDNTVMPSEDRIVASFEDYVSKNPLECSKKSSDIVGADRKIQYVFLSGLGNAINSKKQVDWASLLPVIKSIFGNAISSTSYRSTSFDPVMESFKIIEHGLKDTTKLDYILKDQIWEIITQMIEIGNNHPGCDEYSNESTNSLTIMINDLGGLSLNALFRYVIWCNGNEKSKHIFTEQIKKVVKNYVDKLHGDHTIAKHAALGLYTPTMFYFDEDWTDKLLDGKIFSNKDVKIAFWDSYVTNNVNKHLLTHLYKLYKEFLNGKILCDLHEKDVYQSTIDHVVLGYLYDVENYDKLFNDFINFIDDDDDDDIQSINNCGFFISRILADNPNVDTFKDKIEFLWQNQKFIDHIDLISWSAKSPFDKKKTMELILQYMKRCTKKFSATLFLLDELDKYIDDYPFEVAQCIELFINNLDDYRYLPRNIEDMIKTLSIKKIKNVDEICQNIKEKLVENGHNKYKDLF